MTLKREGEKDVVIYSKLAIGGPAKNKALIATPDAILDKLREHFPGQVRSSKLAKSISASRSFSSTDYDLVSHSLSQVTGNSGVAALLNE